MPNARVCEVDPNNPLASSPRLVIRMISATPAKDRPTVTKRAKSPESEKNLLPETVRPRLEKQEKWPTLTDTLHFGPSGPPNTGFVIAMTMGHKYPERDYQLKFIPWAIPRCHTKVSTGGAIVCHKPSSDDQHCFDVCAPSPGTSPCAHEQLQSVCDEAKYAVRCHDRLTNSASRKKSGSKRPTLSAPGPNPSISNFLFRDASLAHLAKDTIANQERTILLW